MGRSPCLKMYVIEAEVLLYYSVERVTARSAMYKTTRTRALLINHVTSILGDLIIIGDDNADYDCVIIMWLGSECCYTVSTG